MSTLEHAIEIAARAHAGQKDKAGAPYILHPLRVMLRMESAAERMAAVLQDVVEDCGLTIEKLGAEGFPEEVLRAVDALTRRKEESYEDFIRRAAANPIARRVKIADLEDNLDLSRIAQPMERDFKRIEKYRRALEAIKET